jgi:hypothetical protein
MFLGRGARPVSRADNLKAMCKPLIYTMWDPQNLTLTLLPYLECQFKDFHHMSFHSLCWFHLFFFFLLAIALHELKKLFKRRRPEGAQNDMTVSRDRL